MFAPATPVHLRSASCRRLSWRRGHEGFPRQDSLRKSRYNGFALAVASVDLVICWRVSDPIGSVDPARGGGQEWFSELVIFGLDTMRPFDRLHETLRSLNLV